MIQCSLIFFLLIGTVFSDIKHRITYAECSTFAELNIGDQMFHQLYGDYISNEKFNIANQTLYK